MVLRRPPAGGARSTFSASRAKSIYQPGPDGGRDDPFGRPRVSNASTLAHGRARPTTFYEGATSDSGALRRTATQSKLPKELRDREREKEVRACGGMLKGDGPGGRKAGLPPSPAARRARSCGALQAKLAQAKEAEKNALSPEVRQAIDQYNAKADLEKYGHPAACLHGTPVLTEISAPARSWSVSSLTLEVFVRRPPPQADEALLVVQLASAELILVSLDDGRLLSRWQLKDGWPLATYDSGVDQDGQQRAVRRGADAPTMGAESLGFHRRGRGSPCRPYLLPPAAAGQGHRARDAAHGIGHGAPRTGSDHAWPRLRQRSLLTRQRRLVRWAGLPPGPRHSPAPDLPQARRSHQAIEQGGCPACGGLGGRPHQQNRGRRRTARHSVRPPCDGAPACTFSH